MANRAFQQVKVSLQELFDDTSLSQMERQESYEQISNMLQTWAQSNQITTSQAAGQSQHAGNKPNPNNPGRLPG